MYLEQVIGLHLILYFLISKLEIMLCDLTPTKDFSEVIESNVHILIIMVPKEREDTILFTAGTATTLRPTQV